MGPMPTLNHDQITAVRRFAITLRNCYDERMKELTAKDDDASAKATLLYAIKVLNIHLDLAEYEFQKYADDFEKHSNQKK